jgi:tetrathionate reductase subunit A
VDPTHSSGNAWLDWVTGASVRQALPARIERVALHSSKKERFE